MQLEKFRTTKGLSYKKLADLIGVVGVSPANHYNLGGARDLGCLAEIGSKSLKRKPKARCCRLVFMNKKKQKLTGTINNYPLVEVRWLDAVGDSGWMQLDKAMASKPAAPVSLGYKITSHKRKNYNLYRLHC